MSKKFVQFDDSNAANHLTTRNKIKKRKPTPYVSKLVKTVGVELKPKVLFASDDNNVERDVQTRSKIKRQATPYHINKKSDTTVSDNLRKDLFSINMDENDIDTSLTSVNSSPRLTGKSRSKISKTAAATSNGSMEVKEIICNNKNNSVTLELPDSSSEDSDVFNPTSSNSTFNGSFDKIETRKKRRKSSQSKANKRLLLSNPTPTNFNELDVTVDDPEEEELSTQELINEQLGDETVENIEVSSEREDIKVDNSQETYKNGNNKVKKSSRRRANKRLLRSNPTNFKELDVTIDDSILPEKDELSTEELNDETVENIEVSSEIEDMEVDNFQRTYKSVKNNVARNYTLFTYNDVNFLVLNSNSKLFFNGLMSITVLHGEVEILGYTLTSSSGNQNVYSPRGTLHLYFETKLGIKNQYDDGFMKKINEFIPKEELAAFKKVAKIDRCVLMYKNLEQQEIKFVEKHIAQALVPEEGCVFREMKKGWNVLKVDPKWDKIADSMIFNSKLLLTGGKGVGKSTMLRYILNKLLLKHSAVVVIDLDPGQPEFTLPGCVSLHIIKEPVFGPNYTHLRTPYRSVFVSDLNIASMPKNYLDRIDDLYSTGGTEAGYPTIINYVGLTRDNGLDLLSSVISYAKPTMVVEIRSKTESRNFIQPLSRDLLVNSKLYSSSRYISAEEFPKFKIETISSICEENRGWILSSRNVREMKILNYFGKIFSEDDLKLESTPEFTYKINISDIKLRCQYKECRINLIDQSLVAMCSDKGICYGWGIVCTVDLDRNELYIQTPMDSNLLSLISVLNKGSVALPPCFYMAYNYSNIPNKYVCGGIIEDTGRLPMRSFLPAAHYQK